MRQITILFGLGALLLLTGCPLFQKKTGPAIGPQVSTATPAAAELVAQLNDNAHKVQSLGCRNMDIDAEIGLQGWMYCQKPKSFRMNAKAAGATELDLGSNNNEFWFWIRRADPPYLYHCSHEEFARGNVRLPFPFQPEWLMEALGIGEYDPAHQYQVVANKGTIELIEQGTLPQGQRVNKVTVFARGQNGLQVSGHILKDEQNHVIASATIDRTQIVAGAVLPKVIKLSWEADHSKMTLRLNDLSVNGREGDRNSELYARPNWKDVRTYDLARNPANPTGQVRRLSSQPLQ